MTENDSEIKQKINRAINLTKDLDEPYRSKAFEIIFNDLLHSQIKTEPAVVKPNNEKKPDKGTFENGLDLNKKIENFATKCGLSVQQLKNVYDFTDNKPIVIIPRKGTEIENQILTSRLLLVAYDEIFNQEWISLRQDLTEHGIKSLGNLAANLDRNSQLFRSRGQGRWVT
jgi:hypothetical protein